VSEKSDTTVNRLGNLTFCFIQGLDWHPLFADLCSIMD
jgi:hypothetical protein